MKKYLWRLVGIFIILLFTGCSSRQETFENAFKAINLKNQSTDTSVYIDTSKHDLKIENILNQTKSLISQNGFKVKYDCIFKPKVDKDIFSYFNNTYLILDGNYKLDKCEAKKDEISFLDDIHFIDNKIYFEQKDLSEMEILNLYINFLMYLKETPYEKEQSITQIHNIPILFNLNAESFSQKKLIIDDSFLQAMNLKTSLEKYALKNKYQIAETAENADIVIEINNLAFGNNLTVNKDLHEYVFMKKRTKISSVTGIPVLFPLELTIFTFELINKFVSENDQDKLLYSLNECQIKQNGNIDQTYLNNYIHKNYNINVLSLSTINMINEKLASNLIEYRFKSQKKENNNDKM